MRHPCESCTKGRGEFQSTHPLRGATRVKSCFVFARKISIHAPLAGCDARQILLCLRPEDFNPRTPCGVRRRGWEASMADGQFQSTHPLRGATAGRNGVLPLEQFQSTHPLRGATQNKHQQFAVQEISIHAPLAGCDYSSHHSRQDHRNFNPRTPCGVRPFANYAADKTVEFQSTHPLRGATKALENHQKGEIISIHAPLAGCDPLRIMLRTRPSNFNPRTPCGVRPRRWKTTKKAKLFQSTHPLRGATSAFRTQQSSDFGFQSTHPLRGATDIIFDCMNCMKISIHAPLAGCDSLNFEKTELEKISIHAPLAGCDCPHRIYAHRSCHFNPRTPCGVRLLRTVYLD